MKSRFNTEFDSRITRVSSGPAGITRPSFVQAPLNDPGAPSTWGQHALDMGWFERVYCLHCGRSGGAVSADIPTALRGDPGVIYICGECDGKFGRLPAHAIGFERRES